jgi:hypothetical protein
MKDYRDATAQMLQLLDYDRKLINIISGAMCVINMFDKQDITIVIERDCRMLDSMRLENIDDWYVVAPRHLYENVESDEDDKLKMCVIDKAVLFRHRNIEEAIINPDYIYSGADKMQYRWIKELRDVKAPIELSFETIFDLLNPREDFIPLE